MSRIIYKIVPTTLWQDALKSGEFEGAPVDHADGFIHFSTAAQAVETAARHFAGQEGLLLVAMTFAACFAGYEAIRRIGVLRPLFGLKRKADTRASASASLAATDA